VFVTHDQEEAMDVSDRIVLMDHGQIEQIGPPRELYEHPANEFVMGFIGEVNRLDDGWVRPHDIDILLDEVPGSVEALIERVVYLGFEVRVELVRRDGEHVWAQVPRDQAEQLELREGQIVNTRAREARTFPIAASRSLNAPELVEA
jgi:sulfate transport system ATP-binding protein